MLLLPAGLQPHCPLYSLMTAGFPTTGPLHLLFALPGALPSIASKQKAASQLFSEAGAPTLSCHLTYSAHPEPAPVPTCYVLSSSQQCTPYRLYKAMFFVWKNPLSTQAVFHWRLNVRGQEPSMHAQGNRLLLGRG